MAIQEGKPIWGESLLTSAEWAIEAKKFPSVYQRKDPPPMFQCEFMWRQGMGASLRSLEIQLINERLDAFLKLVRDGN